MSSMLFLVLSAPCRFMRRCFSGTETLEYSTSFAVVISSSQKFSATMRLIIDQGKTLIRFVQKRKSSLITTGDSAYPVAVASTTIDFSSIFQCRSRISVFPSLLRVAKSSVPFLKLKFASLSTNSRLKHIMFHIS